MSDDRSYADVAARVFRTFHAMYPLPVIIAVLQRCRTDLDSVPAGAMPELWQRLARQRLSALPPAI